MLGDRVERVNRGHYRVRLNDGKELLTHGPDAAVEDHDTNFQPGAAERPPVCAPDYHQYVLYGRPASTPNRYAAVKPQIQSAIRRMNNVLNQESVESGARTADFRVRCDAAGQVEVGQFAGSASDFNNVVTAARLAGFTHPRANYTIFWDGGDTYACGVASFSDDERLTADNLNNQGGGYAVAYSDCWLGRTPMHEAAHNLGAVQYGSPFSTGTGAHCRDGWDVMCYSDGGDRDTGMIARCTDRMHFDCGNDDYFDSAPEPGEYLASHWNIGSTLNRFVSFGGSTTVMGWGLNNVGQLGIGTILGSLLPQIAGVRAVESVAGGGFHGLARALDGTVWGWGMNHVGQLGIGSTADALLPVQVPGLTDVVAVAGGLAHSLAVKADGTVWAWGWNPWGQLGDGSLLDRSTPVQVAGLDNVVAVAAGAGHSLAVKGDGTLWAWGLNLYGQLGTGSASPSVLAPAPVPGLTSVRSVAAGGFHTLAAKTDGSVWTWGWNAFGQLGNGTVSVSSPVPVAATGLSGVVEVTAGFYHDLARKTDGTVWSWGWNGTGQLGNGTAVDGRVPRQVPGVTAATGIAAGAYHSLVLRSDQTVYGAGWGGWGQLGAAQVLLTPKSVFSGKKVRAVSAGIGHNLTVVGD